MTVYRQKRKCFLTLHRQIMTVDRLKLTFRIEQFQALERFPFLILKSLLFLPRRRAMQLSAVGGGANPCSIERNALWITLTKQFFVERNRHAVGKKKLLGKIKPRLWHRHSSTTRL
jgi:hypothetical protein